jgi:hypothetical protein
MVGLPNVGKSTLFNALTKAGIAAENYPASWATQKSQWPQGVPGFHRNRSAKPEQTMLLTVASAGKGHLRIALFFCGGNWVINEIGMTGRTGVAN